MGEHSYTFSELSPLSENIEYGCSVNSTSLEFLPLNTTSTPGTGL